MTADTVLATITTRRIPAHEGAGIRATVESWLGGRGSLAATFPQAFHRDARAEQAMLVQGDRVVSHAVVVDATIRTPHGPVHASLVGSVATAPDLRGRGLASALLEAIAAGSRDQGRDVVLLWSERGSFYARLGFQPVGQQHELVLQRRLGSLAPGIRQALAQDLPELLAWHRDKPVAVERDYQDLALLLSARPMTTMVLERQGRIAAYACHGKGMDFGGWWHEVGGADADVATLVLGAMDVLGQDEATLLVPPYRREIAPLLGRAVLAARTGASALGLALSDRGRLELFVDGLDSV